MRKSIFKGIFVCLITGLLWSLGAITAFAAGSIDYIYIDSGVDFKLYKVADETDNGGYTLSDDFSKYPVSLSGKTAASTLAAYAARDKIAPTAEAETDNEGEVHFSGLEDGEYLIVGESYIEDEKQYIIMPVIVIIDESGNDVVESKYRTRFLSDYPDDTYDLSVLKVWSGSKGEDEVIAQLLCDGAVYDEVTLNSSNNWRHTWRDLPVYYNWIVVEKYVPSGYQLEIEADGDVFVLTNASEPNSPGLPPETVVTTEATSEAATEATTEAPVETTTKSSGNVGKEPTTETTTQKTETPTETTTTKRTPHGGGNSYPLNEPEETTKTPSASSHNEPSVETETQTAPDTLDIPNVEPAETTTETPAVETTAAPQEAPAEKLPQTGQLWFPVPVLACLGILLVIVGIGKKRG